MNEEVSAFATTVWGDSFSNSALSISLIGEPHRIERIDSGAIALIDSCSIGTRAYSIIVGSGGGATIIEDLRIFSLCFGVKTAMCKGEFGSLEVAPTLSLGVLVATISSLDGLGIGFSKGDSRVVEAWPLGPGLANDDPWVFVLDNNEEIIMGGW
eukprot:Gb_29452 [translate_table: standard]